MCKVAVTTQHANYNLNIEPHAKLFDCLPRALAAALPVFAKELMTCMTGTATEDDYTPGDRQRCGRTG